jgi:transcriptional regulator GlxA family with amidase domain
MGAFLLAEAGLLDGRKATTHWHVTDQLRSQRAEIDVVNDVTSAGLAAAIADNLTGTLDWVTTHLDEEMSLKAMASRANLSVRQFSRRFHETTGTTPHQWLIRHRILRAQELLEQGGLSIEEVARSSGFQSAAAMRPHFTRQVTTSPAEYKRSFAAR